MIDLHCDTILALLEKRQNGENISFVDNSCCVNLDKLSAGSLQCFALFTDRMACPVPEARALELYDLYCEMLETHPDKIRPVLTWNDYEQNRKEGKISALLTLEDGGVVFNGLAMLRNWSRLGVRMIALNWNYPNGIGHPNFVMEPDADYRKGRPDLILNETDGLTEFGKAYVREMEQWHMIPDVSHLSDKAFWDVIETAKGPVVASHSNCRALCPVSRNLTDDMIRAIAKTGGVVGLNFCADFLNLEAGGLSRVEDMVAHLKHLKEVGGPEVLALGTDFDGIVCRMEIEDCTGLDKLVDAMKESGFSSDEIRGFVRGNFERVLKQVLA